MSNNKKVELSQPAKPRRLVAGEKLRGADKVARNPVKIIATDKPARKPEWIRVRMPGTTRINNIKAKLRQHKLHTVCEEAACPNLGECFGGGTATFMIMGDICTRRCPFCDVAHGRPKPLDENEPANLAQAISEMALKYVVITSVDRDDLRDGGAQHFANCISETRAQCTAIDIEILVPDFRGRMDVAVDILTRNPPDVFNHNLETIPRLYPKARPGADYAWSLSLLKNYKARNPEVTTKSGLMLGLGEEIGEVEAVMADLRRHDVDMLTLGQYLQPSGDHLPVERYVTPEEFKHLGRLGETMGFKRVASAPLVRSSYHADLQAKGHKVC